MTPQAKVDVASALRATLISPNESDANFEAANVVDGLFAIARALSDLAAATRSISHGGLDGPTGLEALSMTINGGRNGEWPSVAEAIRDAQ